MHEDLFDKLAAAFRPIAAKMLVGETDWKSIFLEARSGTAMLWRHARAAARS
jgi:hypothetical protein